jgi:hypothetical protein
MGGAGGPTGLTPPARARRGRTGVAASPVAPYITHGAWQAGVMN